MTMASTSTADQNIPVVKDDEDGDPTVFLDAEEAALDKIGSSKPAHQYRPSADTMYVDAEEAALNKVGSSKPAYHFSQRRASLADLKHSISEMGTTLRDMLVRTFSSRRAFPMPFQLEEDHLLNEMMEELSDDEMETAARASYEYLLKPDEKEQLRYAKQYALKFLKAKKNDVEKAVSRMKETLEFRKEKNVDQLRLAFNNETSGDDTSNEQTKECAERLEQEIRSRNCFVQGFDKEGRSTYIFIPRNVKGHDEEWTLKEHIYSLERAVACSRCEDKTVNAIVDFNGFSLKNAPPTHLGKEFVVTFRNHYAGAINSIFLLDAPTSFWCLWSVFKPLVAEQTRRRIHFISSKKNELAEHYDPEEATPWMMTAGAKTRELDVDEYLFQTPFNRAFDDGEPSS